MKKSFIGYALTLVMAFGIASCGKSGGGGGGGITSTSLITSGTLDPNSQQYANYLNQWIQGTETITDPNGCGAFNVTRSVSTVASGSNNSNCQQGTFLGFLPYTYCSSSSGSSSNTGTPQAPVLTNVNCSATVRSGYASIQNILASGTMVQIQLVSSTAFKVVVQTASGYVTHVIDTSLPAAFQPVSSYNNSTGVQTILTNIQRPY